MKKAWILVAVGLGVLVSQTFGQSTLNVKLGGWTVLATKYTKDSKGVHLRSAEIHLYTDMGNDSPIVFPTVELTKDQGLVSCAPAKGIGDFLTTQNGVTVSASGFQLKSTGTYGPGLYLKGSLRFENSTSSLVFPDYTVLLDPSGEVRYDAKLGKATALARFTYKGWNLFPENEASGDGGVSLTNVKLVVPNTKVQITFPELRFWADGGLNTLTDQGGVRPITDQPTIIEYNGWKIDVNQASLEESGLLALECFVELPFATISQSIQWDSLKLKSDGSSDATSALRETDFVWGNLDFYLRNVRLDAGGLSVGELQLTFPSSVATRKLVAYSLHLSAGGVLGSDIDLFDPLWLASGNSVTLSKIVMSPSNAQFYIHSQSGGQDQLFMEATSEGEYSYHQQ